MKDANWFPHDSNAHDDDRILMLRAEYDWQGYGLFWALIEKMRDAANYRVRMASLPGIAYGLHVELEYLTRFIEFCASENVGLVIIRDGYLSSPRLSRSMEHYDAVRRTRADAGKKGAKQRAIEEDGQMVEHDNSSAQQMLSKCSANARQMSNNKSIGEDKREENTPPIPPSGGIDDDGRISGCELSGERCEDEPTPPEPPNAARALTSELVAESPPVTPPAETSAIPQPGPPKRERKRGRPVTSRTGPAGEIYAIYPKHVAPLEALKAIEKAIAVVGIDRLRERTQAYAAAVALWPKGDRVWVPNPASWFNRGSYDDDPECWQRRQPNTNGARAPNGVTGLPRMMMTHAEAEQRAAREKIANWQGFYERAWNTTTGLPHYRDPRYRSEPLPDGFQHDRPEKKQCDQPGITPSATATDPNIRIPAGQIATAGQIGQIPR